MTRALLSLLAAALSYGWWRAVLGGAPKVIDATTYWLQARAIAEGHLTWSPPGALGSFAGRFLLVGAHGRVGGIFPQGFPALLAVGMWSGAPWLTGCALAAAISWVTGSLAAAMEPDARRRSLALVTATWLSVLCATMRFHTAETMSHGAAALAFSCALLAGLRATGPRGWAACGLAAGVLVTIRPVSALAVSVVCGALAWRSGRWRALAWCVVGAMPGMVFHALAQRAVTGAWGASTQTMYYALSDGPRGCFRYGFGASVGCRVEHGDFVARHLPHGYGAREALWVTLRRLRAHVRDVANFEALSLVLLAVLVTARRERALRYGVAAVLAQIVAYAPFYFDGNIEGGGARMLVDALPAEHAMLGVVLARFGRRPAAGFALASVVCGALWGSRGHLAVRSLPDHGAHALERSGISRGLVFVDDDHAFAILHRPDASVRNGVVVARYRGDAFDGLLYAHLGRPPTWRLRVTRGVGELVAWSPEVPTDRWWFRGASLWPPTLQSRGYVRPRGDGALDVVRDGAVRVEVTVPTPRRGAWCARVAYADGDGETRCDDNVTALRVTLGRAGVVRGVEVTRAQPMASGTARPMVGSAEARCDQARSSAAPRVPWSEPEPTS